MNDTFDKIKSLKKWEKEHPGQLDKKPKAIMSVIVTKPMVKTIIEKFAKMRNDALAKLVGIEPFQLNMVLSYMRKAGVNLPPKNEINIKAKIAMFVAELKEEGLVKSEDELSNCCGAHIINGRCSDCKEGVK